MAPDSSGQTRNREIVRRINKRLLRRAVLLSRRMQGQRFRSAVQAQEAMEVAGLKVYDPCQPTHLIDFSRLNVHPKHLAGAMANDELLVKRFERVVENEFVILIDMSRSMRYPLRRLYGGELLGELDSEIEWAKPSLIKLVAGTFMNAAAGSGFRVRVVMFGQDRIDEGRALRRRPDLMGDLLEPIDARFFALAREPVIETPMLPAVIERVAKWKGVFLLISDFVDPVFDWEDRGKRAGWFKVLDLMKDWGARRPLLVARINQDVELRPPPDPSAAQLRNPFEDRCDVQIEGGKYDKDSSEAGFEGKRESMVRAIERCRKQREWTAALSRVLRSCCRGVLAVDNAVDERRLSREIHHMWSRLTER